MYAMEVEWSVVDFTEWLSDSVSCPCFLMGTIKWCLSSTNSLEKNILKFKMCSGHLRCILLSDAIWKTGSSLSLSPLFWDCFFALNSPKENIPYRITSDHTYFGRVHLQDSNTNIYQWKMTLLSRIENVSEFPERCWYFEEVDWKRVSAFTYISVPSITLIWSQSPISREAARPLINSSNLAFFFCVWISIHTSKQTDWGRETKQQHSKNYWPWSGQNTFINQPSEVSCSCDCQLAVRGLLIVLFSVSSHNSDVSLVRWVILPFTLFPLLSHALCLENAKRCLHFARTVASNLILWMCKGVSNHLMSLDLIIALHGHITVNKWDCFTGQGSAHCSLNMAMILFLPIKLNKSQRGLMNTMKNKIFPSKQI